jgi:hypothetical protein
MSHVVALRGPMGSYKSSFANSNQGKKHWFDLEMGAHRAWQFDASQSILWQLPKLDGDAVLASLMAGKRSKVVGRIAQYEAIATEFIRVIQDPQVTDIVFDTAKELWTICHQAFLEERQSEKAGKETLSPIEYATPNTRMANLIYLARNADKNLWLINHERPIYKDMIVDGKMEKVASDEMELDGWSKTLDLADWIFVTRFDRESKKATIICEKSEQDSSLVGEIVPGDPPTWTGWLAYTLAKAKANATTTSGS